MEGVDLRIRPVNQLLGEVAPFDQQHVHLRRQDVPFSGKIQEKWHHVYVCVCGKVWRLT